MKTYSFLQEKSLRKTFSLPWLRECHNSFFCQTSVAEFFSRGVHTSLAKRVQLDVPKSIVKSRSFFFPTYVLKVDEVCIAAKTPIREKEAFILSFHASRKFISAEVFEKRLF